MKNFVTDAVINLWGNTGGEAEMRYSPTGKRVTTLTVFVRDKAYKGKEKRSVPYKCVAWDEDAEVLNREIAKGGMAVFVVGQYRSSMYDNKNGVRSVSHEVLVYKCGIFNEGGELKMLELKGWCGFGRSPDGKLGGLMKPSERVSE